MLSVLPEIANRAHAPTVILPRNPVFAQCRNAEMNHVCYQDNQRHPEENISAHKKANSKINNDH